MLIESVQACSETRAVVCSVVSRLFWCALVPSNRWCFATLTRRKFVLQQITFNWTCFEAALLSAQYRTVASVYRLTVSLFSGNICNRVLMWPTASIQCKLRTKQGLVRVSGRWCSHVVWLPYALQESVGELFRFVRLPLYACSNESMLA